MDEINIITDLEDKFLNLSVRPIKERYYDEDTGWGIYICDNLNNTLGKPITITGSMPRLYIDSKYDLMAKQIIHPKFGTQYEIYSPSIKLSKPNTSEDEKSFIKNLVTEIQYREIIKVYDKPITAIASGEFDISKIKYFGERNLQALKKKIEENLYLITISNEIGKYGIDFRQIKRIVKHYGNAELALQKIKADPYVLYKEVDGFGFLRTDLIAKHMGIEAVDERRIKAGILYCLEQEENKGNTYGYLEDIHDRAESLLEISIDNISSYVESKDFYVDDFVLARSSTYQCEMDIAKELKRISDNNIQLFKPDIIDESINKIEFELGIKYDIKQKDLFYSIDENNVVLFTGFAGTGKSSTLKGLLDMFDSNNINYILMSPTAKAAKRMEETTGRDASTIHRALGYFEGEFSHDKENPFETDIVIIDEVSMTDIFLFRSVLEAVSNKSKLLCVGDYGQLESISVGNVLYDMINSGVISCVKLEKVFRQQGDSKLLEVITAIRNGEIFFDSKKKFMELGKDCKLWFGSKDVTTQHVAAIYKECLKKYKVEDIMVISPMKKGNSGVVNLNNILQSIANKPDDFKNQIDLKRCIFREGDIVMHTKNDYNAEVLDENYEPTGELGVFNGDTGYIKQINLVKSVENYTDYQGKLIEYSTENINELDLAYAITVHKSQGSQSKVVILVMDTSHYIMLKRSLAYTGASRASELLIIIADPRALERAIKNNEIINKRTFLLEDLKKVFNQVNN